MTTQTILEQAGIPLLLFVICMYYGLKLMILQDAFVFRKSAGAFLRIRFCIIEKVWNTVILPSVHSNTLLRRFPVNGNSLFLIIQKTVPDSSSETVIITYYRGTTQLGVSPTFSRTIIRS